MYLSRQKSRASVRGIPIHKDENAAKQGKSLSDQSKRSNPQSTFALYCDRLHFPDTYENRNENEIRPVWTRLT